LGIGKTALLRAFAEGLPAERLLFWYEFLPGLSTLESVLPALAHFLDSHSQHTRFLRLVNSAELSAAEKIRLLVREANRIGAYLFFDRFDLVEGNGPLEAFFAIIKAELDNARVFIASRSKPTFITPLDEAKRQALIMPISGFTVTDVSDYFERKGIALEDDEAERLHHDLDGMPLTVELLVALLEDGGGAADLLNKVEIVRDRVTEQLFEELYARLSPNNRQFLTTAALLRLPFTKERLLDAHRALFNQNAAGDFLALRRRCCLMPIGDSDYYSVEEFIRTLALSSTSQDLNELRRNLAKHLLASFPDDYFANLEALLLLRDCKDWEGAAEVAGDLIYRRFVPYDLDMAQMVLSIFSEEKMPQERWIWVLGDKGLVAAHSRQFDEAETCYQKMLTLAQESNNKPAEALALQRLGALSHDLDDDATSENFYIRSLALKTELEDFEGQAEIHNNLGSIYSSQGDYEKASAELEKGLELRRQIQSPEWLYIALYSNLGILYARQERWAEALDFGKKALQASEDLDSPYDIAKAMFNLGKQDAERGNRQSALQKFEKVLQVAEEYELDELEELGSIAAGRVHADNGDFDQAIHYFKRVAALYERLNMTPKIAAIYFDIGTFYQRKEDHSSALEWYLKGILLFDSFRDEEQIDLYLRNVWVMAHKLKSEPRLRDLIRALKDLKTRLTRDGMTFALARVYGTLGDIYMDVLDRERAAVACLRQELGLLSGLGRRRDEVLANIELAGTLQQYGRYSEAFEALEAALDIAKKEDLSELLGTILYNRGNYYAEIEMYPESETSLREAEQVASQSEHPNLLRMVQHNLGETYRRQGRLDEAVGLLTNVLSQDREANDAYGIVHSANNLGLAYEEMGEEQEALKCWHEAVSASRADSLKHEEANALISIGNFHLARDQAAQAKTYYYDALTIARDIEDADLEEGCILSLAQVHKDLGTFDSIKEEFKRVAERANELGHHANFISFLLLAGEIDLEEGDADTAAAMYEHAILFALSRAITLSNQFAKSTLKPRSATDIARVLNRILVAIDQGLKNNQRQSVEEMYDALISRLKSRGYWEDGGFPIDYLTLIGDFLTARPTQSIREYMAKRYRA
jgi:tetratricopeptide (TPR) repeat protein